MKKILSNIALALIVSTTIAPIVTAQESAATLPKVTGLEVTSTTSESVSLKWNAVTGVNNYLLTYGTESVTGNEAYNLPPITTGNKTSYTVSSLTSGTKYYFSVIATDGTNFSASYSDEVSATPSSSVGSLEGDIVLPSASGSISVTGASATDNKTVRVVLSGDAAIPTDIASHVTITRLFNNSPLSVTSGRKVDANTIELVTEPQEAGTEYGVQLSNAFGFANPEDGYAEFIGSSLADNGNTGFKIEEVNSSIDNVEVEFSEEIVLGPNPTAEIAIVETDNPSISVRVTEVVQNEIEKNKVLIKTSEQDPVAYTLLVTNVTNVAGDGLSDENSTFDFIGAGANQGADTTPPEDVTKLAGRVVDMIASLTWSKSLNTAGDLANYLVYISLDGGTTFQLLSTLESDASGFESASLAKQDEYTFKVTAIDEAGNESTGEVVTLPGTGPAGVLALLFSSMGGASLVRRRK